MPEEMEDKWFVYSKDGDGDEDGRDGGTGEDSDEEEPEPEPEPEINNNTHKDIQKANNKTSNDPPTTPEILRLFMVRSWTGNLVYIVRILVQREESRSGGKKGEGEMEGRILGIVWEGDEKLVRGQDESVAKETAREVCRWILGVQLLPDVPAPRRGKVGLKEESEIGSLQ